MAVKDEIRFYDVSALSVTPGIYDRCNAAYLQKQLEIRFPEEQFRVLHVLLNETGSYNSQDWPMSHLRSRTQFDGLPAYCEVVINHITGAADENIIVWCPLAWNDRFTGTAGGGTLTGGFSHLVPPTNAIRDWLVSDAVINGFSAATTDAGNNIHGENWALDPKTGEILWDRVKNWHGRSTHNMTLFGKAVTEILHQRPVQYAYLSGESGGGRQCIVSAQAYPRDYDGIWASNPGVNWHDLAICAAWPLAVMNTQKNYVNREKMEYFARKVHESVGGSAAYYSMTERVDFDPFALVGHDSGNGVITAEDAAVVGRIWDGPRRPDGRQICPGFRPGVINWLSVQPVGFFYYEPGVSKPKLFPLATHMLRWAVQDPGRTFDDVTEADVEMLYDSLKTHFADTYADQADLRQFAALGGKLLADHGVDDALICIDNFLSYYHRLLENHGGKEALDTFARVYVMPGCCHSSCYGNGPGIAQATGMQALIRWVEEGIAPGVLPTVQLDRRTEEILARSEVAPL